MHVHHPGRPEDLPPPRELWARWAFAAALTATAGGISAASRIGWWAAGDTLRHDDAGTSWWVLRRFAADRFLLSGWDESGDVIGWEPPVDLLAGAPGWLTPAVLGTTAGDAEPGCAYWWDGGSWARAPYPDGLGDDGLDFGMDAVLSVPRLLSALDWEDVPELAGAVAGSAGAAVAGTLTADGVAALAARAAARGVTAPDLPAVLAALSATELSATGLSATGLSGGGPSATGPAPAR